MKTTKLDSIQALRGIAVLIVIAFHFRGFLNNVYVQSNLGDLLFIGGEIGIEIFFVISGFIITYSTINKKSSHPLEFGCKRFFRLYPLFFIVLTLMIFLDINTTYTTSQIIKSYLLIPNDYNFIGPWYGYNIIGPAWTLTYEILFYIIFFVSLCISHRYRTILSIIILIIVCSLAQYYFTGTLRIEPVFKNELSYSFVSNLLFLSNPIIYDFIYGMIIAEVYIRIKDKYIENKYAVAILSSLALASVVAIISGYNQGLGVDKWGFYSFILVGAIAILSKIISIYNGRGLIFIGEISYSLYINHMVVYALSLIYLKDYITFESGGFSVFFALVIITFLVSIMTYFFIEKPSVRLGKKLVSLIQSRY